MSGGGGRAAGMFIVLALAGATMLFLVVLLENARDPVQMLTGLLGLGGMGWLLLRGPVANALATMLEGRVGDGGDAMLSARMADLEDRLQELTLETQRFMEIEDRLEFTERLIAAREDPARGRDDGR